MGRQIITALEEANSGWVLEIPAMVDGDPQEVERLRAVCFGSMGRLGDHELVTTYFKDSGIQDIDRWQIEIPFELN